MSPRHYTPRSGKITELLKLLLEHLNELNIDDEEWKSQMLAITSNSGLGDTEKFERLCALAKTAKFGDTEEGTIGADSDVSGKCDVEGTVVFF